MRTMNSSGVTCSRMYVSSDDIHVILAVHLPAIQ